MKILAVDDEELILELLAEMLRANGFDDVTLAVNADDALKKIASAKVPFDTFMFDIQMPGIDGIELCRQVRAISSHQKTPIIMVTAMNDKEYINKAFSAGATDYVTKPFDMTELISRIRLAQRLQEESQRAERAAASSDVAAKQPYSMPVDVKELSGVVSSNVLKNYVMITAEQRQFPIGALAIQVPELAVVHAGSSNEEFVYVVTDVAEVISDAMTGTQSFLSYIGGGNFLVVGARLQFPSTDLLQNELELMLNNPELVYCAEVPVTFSAIVGEMAAPKLLEKPKNLAFLNRALENLQIAEQSRSVPLQTNALAGGLGSAFAA